MKDLTTVLAMVKKERMRQNEKWGYPQDNHPFAWLSILTEEVGEFAQALNDGDMDNAMEEAVQVAAVAVSIVEHLSEVVP